MPHFARRVQRISSLKNTAKYAMLATVPDGISCEREVRNQRCRSYRPECNAIARRKPQRRKKTLDRSRDDQHRSNSGDEYSGATRVARDRIATTQLPGRDHAGSDHQSGRSGDLNRREFDYAVRRDRRPEIVPESGIGIERTDSAEHQSVLHLDPKRQCAEGYASRERKCGYFDVVRHDGRRHERRLRRIESKVRIVETLANIRGCDTRRQQRHRVSGMISDDDVPDDCARYRQDGASNDRRKRPPELARKRLQVKACNALHSSGRGPAVDARVSARHQPVQVRNEPRVVPASARIRKVARYRPVQRPEGFGILGREPPESPPSRPHQQLIERLPLSGALGDEGGLRHGVPSYARMDRTLDVRTPESIALTYELAGIGSRFLAVALDFVAQIALLALIVWGFYLASRGTPAHTAHVQSAERIWTNLATAVLIAIVFLFFFGYFIIFETAWNGQTPGKRALGLRVVRDGGYPIDFTASLIRNLIRIGELAFGAYALAALAAVISRENKRIGDLAAGTIVVREARMQDGRALFESIESNPHYAATAYLSGEERALIKRFLDRRDGLDAARRIDLAAKIAARIRARLPNDLGSLDDESLLERL